MSKWALISICLLAVLGILYVAELGVFTFGLPGMHSCFDYPIMSVVSPAKKFQAEVENVTCSPENELETQVWLKDNSTNLRFAALIAASAQQESGTYSPLQLKLTWLSNSQLQILIPHGTKVKLEQTDFNGVTVTYRDLPGAAP